ncbi:MAG: hypothetical protein ACTSRS_08935 [Candidatus Helarchaeota archaeon]
MVLVNYGYFLFGIVLLFSWRIIHHIPYFQRTKYPTPGQNVVWLALGGIYLLVIINMLQNVDASFDGFLALLPLILFIFAMFNFWGGSFVSPTKNYLLTLVLTIPISVGILFLIDSLCLLTGFYTTSSYLEILPIILTVFLGIICGIIFYKYFNRRFPNWSAPLWQAHWFWDVINHNTYLLSVAVLATIEALLQMHSTSLIILLTSL